MNYWIRIALLSLIVVFLGFRGLPSAEPLDTWHLIDPAISGPIAYGNGSFVAVGNGDAIFTSPDGVTWTSRGSGIVTSVKQMTYGNGSFVAVEYYGTILTSPDSLTWTSRTSGTTNLLRGVTYGNGSFVAVGDDDTILSTDPLSPSAVLSTLTLFKSTSGTVTSTPSGITCGSTCTATFDSNTSVTLTATPDSGSYFTGWGPPCSGNGTCTVTPSSDTQITAAFNPAGYPFLDVIPGSWAEAYINAIYDAHITTGIGAGLYGPSQTLTREQMAAFIGRAFLNMQTIDWQAYLNYQVGRRWQYSTPDSEGTYSEYIKEITTKNGFNAEG